MKLGERSFFTLSSTLALTPKFPLFASECNKRCFFLLVPFVSEGTEFVIENQPSHICLL